MAGTGEAPTPDSSTHVVYIATLRRANEARLPIPRVFATYEAIVARYGRDDEARREAIRAIQPDVDTRRLGTHVQFDDGATLLYIEKALYHVASGGARRKSKTLRRRK